MTTTTTPAPVYRHAAQLAWLFAQADREGLPAPEHVGFGNTEREHRPSIRLTFDSFADLAAWADRAGEAIGTDAVFLRYGFEGAINEVRVKGSLFTSERVSA